MKKWLAALSIALFASMAAPQSADAGPGGRVGITDDPDTIFVGLHWLVDITRAGPGVINLRPGIDFGIGLDDPINFMFKGAAHFAWEVPVNGQFSIYPLLGPVLTYLNFDSPGDDDSEVDLGVDLGFGFKWDKYAVELWLGIDDDGVNPDLSILFAFTL